MSYYEFVFSPTGGTKAAARLLESAFPEPFVSADLTDRKNPAAGLSLTAEDLCLIAVPSFGGRVPAPAVERLLAVRGNGARCILAAVYGNRAYEDTLSELKAAAEKAGFFPAAAVAAVAEHSIMRQFAAGRPDAADARELAAFSAAIRDRLSSTIPVREAAVPGSLNYRPYRGIPLKPRAGKACTRCGLCASLCPTAAIPAEDPSRTDRAACISCMRCVSVCPQRARSLNRLLLKAAGAGMKPACSGRKPNELFLDSSR